MYIKILDNYKWLGYGTITHNWKDYIKFINRTYPKGFVIQFENMEQLAALYI